MEKLRFRFDGRIAPGDIVDIIDGFRANEVPRINGLTDYSKGNNPPILERQLPVASPQNKVPTPYGRRITSIVSSYMYLPGLISYNSENDELFNSLSDVFMMNEEPLESYRIGWQATVQGVGYELFYSEGLDRVNTILGPGTGRKNTEPLFIRVSVNGVIPIYDYAIDSKITAFIRFYTIKQDEAEYIDVYYSDVIEHYVRKAAATSIRKTGEQSHGYDRPPLVVYDNNDDMMGDFSAVVPLIDAYDVLTSDSMNEFDRFAQAYLIFKGMSLSPEDVETIKYKRAFNVDADGAVTFLTKPIEVEFIQFMTEHLRGEIHRGSGIPNIDDFKWGGGASGETIGKFIYLMELVTGIKEAHFKHGLWDRISMLMGYLKLPGDAHDIGIVMNRNDPDKSLLLAELLKKYSGHVSQRTLLENFADFVDDVDEELVQLAEEKDAAFTPDLDEPAEDTEEEDEDVQDTE